MRLSKWVRGAAAAMVAAACVAVGGTASSAAASDLSPWDDSRQGVFGYSWGFDAAGVTATHSIGTDGSFGSRDNVWAPTVYPGGVACFEMSTVYDGDGRVYLRPYDWCNNGGWQPGWAVDANFRNAYVQDGQYTIRIELTDAGTNTWTAYLRNVGTGNWDYLYSRGGTHDGERSGGWDYFEVFTNYNSDTGMGDYCDRMAGRTFATTGLSFKLNNEWTPAGGVNMNTIDVGNDFSYGCPGLTLSRNSDGWTVTDSGG